MIDELDKLAREIALQPRFVYNDCPVTRGKRIEAARLGLEAGMKLQRERDAVIAEF